MASRPPRPLPRREFVRAATAALLAGPAFGPARAALGAAAPAAGAGLTADQALQRLLEGNRRYAAGSAAHPHQAPTRRQALVAGQQPFAAILGCADSRVPPELLFDQGLGDLFVVRVAGHAADAHVLGSLEYAVAALGVPLVVVLGHEGCGAVQAALAAEAAPGHLGSLVAAIRAALGPAGAASADLDRAVRTHAAAVADRLRTAEPVLARAVRRGAVRVVGGVYRLASGTVDLLG